MSKKILIISSSPRKGGNSDLLCDEFIRGASEAGHKTEKVFLRDKNIHYCIGCGVCNSILESMVEADVIVLATPVYFYTMDAQLKTLIDRTVPRYTEMRNKELYYIMTAADEEIEHMQKTVESLRGFTMDCLDGAVEKGIIYGVGAWNKGEILDTPAMAQAYQMGKNS